MHIASFKIENYKSFRTMEEVQLTSGFTVIVGQNNVGKTALVEALSLSFQGRPHRSLKTAPTALTPVGGNSTVSIRFSMSRDELLQHLSRLGTFWVHTGRSVGRDAAGDFVDSLRDVNTLATTWHNGGLGTTRPEWLPALPTGNHAGAELRVTSDGQIEAAREDIPGINPSSRFEGPLANAIKAERIYAFDAQRLHIGLSQFGTNTTLLPAAQNLPEVLANLGKNRVRFDRLSRLMQTVFPTVRGISIQPRENNQVEILVWTIDPQTERADLAIPLLESGTGIGQVLALLYVVLTAESPRLVLIDEPQSFLHPGAVRKLIEILKQHPQHQFIITTHSPTALTAADPENLLRLSIEGGESKVESLNVAQARDLRLALADVGARLSDVFGADNILWVEGRTEELCFPKIVQRLTTQPLLGTAIVGVLHTADFDARRSEATVELYNRLSAGRGLLPLAVGFIFDREGRSPRDREDLERRGNVFFLPRRMYENYLIDPAAIAAVGSSIEGFRNGPLTEADVRAWLGQNAWNAQYFDKLPAERTDTVWWTEVRGANLLEDLFGQLSEHRVQYDKVRHGVALTDWLLDNSREDLLEVAQLIDRALATGGTTGGQPGEKAQIP